MNPKTPKPTRMPMAHEINSSRLRGGCFSTGGECSALLLSGFIHLPRAACETGVPGSELNRSGRTQGDRSSPRNGGYALPA